MGPGLRRFLLGCVWLAVLLMVGPLVISLLGIGSAVKGVDGGLREASKRIELQEKVGFAFNTTFLVALCAPAGVFLLVLAGLPLASERKRLADLERTRQPR
jgi:ABC-type Fe3+ transport system permease subunit